MRTLVGRCEFRCRKNIPRLFRSKRCSIQFNGSIRTKIPYVRLPKYGAIGTLGPFRLFDSSFASPWQLKLHDTSLNLQRGLVVEILASQVVRSKVTTNAFLASFNFRIRKRLEIPDCSFATDFVLLEGARNKSNLSSASIVMLSTELSTAWRLSMNFSE